MDMPWLDLGLAAVLIAFSANGLRQGLVRQAAGLMGLLLGLASAVALYAPLMVHVAPTPEAALTFGPLIFLAVWLSIWGTFYLLGFVAWKRLHAKEYSWGDDVGGAFLGLVAGALALGVCLAGLASLDRSFAQQVERSHLGLWLLNMTPAFFRLLPSELQLPAWLQ